MLNKYLLSIYYVPKIFVSMKQISAVNKADTCLCLHGTYIPMDGEIVLFLIRMSVLKKMYRGPAYSEMSEKMSPRK